MALTKAKFGVISSALASGNATDGYVLTADGSGNSAWEEVAGGPTHKTFGTSSIMIGDSTTGTIDAADYNTGVGVNVFEDLTSGDNNSALGFNALTNITTGSDNTAIGRTTLVSTTTGSNNTAVGSIALNVNTGDHNTAVGKSALAANTSGTQNNAFGSGSLDACTTGSYNCAFGQATLSNTTTASSNVAVGDNALQFNTTGGSNVAVGENAMRNETTGTDNVSIGHEAGQAIAGRYYNVHVGYACGKTTDGTRNILIGYGAEGSSTSDWNTINLTTRTAAGKGGSTGFIDPNGGGVYQGNNSSSWSTTSDKRIKKNIVDNNIGLDAINQIQVKNFEYRTEEEIVDFDNPSAVAVTQEGIQLGVIAQEIKEILPDVVKQETTGAYTVDPDNITWYLVNAVKELSQQIKELQKKVDK
tara:strand:+ start:663 stop:1910 length:1248 start_codon:yes stop_codon:yes gene_type:complete